MARLLQFPPLLPVSTLFPPFREVETVGKLLKFIYKIASVSTFSRAPRLKVQWGVVEVCGVGLGGKVVTNGR